MEAIHARFTGHAYDLHRHDDWLVGVTEYGLQCFSCAGIPQRSTRDRVILIEPQQAHDGNSGDADGFAYHMLYLPRAWLRDGLHQQRDDRFGFRATLSDDLQLGVAIRTAYAALATGTARLAQDAALDAVLRRLAPHLAIPQTPPALPASSIARRAGDCLQDRLGENIGAEELARLAGAADRFQLARSFRAVYGTSPHAYQRQARLLAARRMLAHDEPPAAVAAACGFADQSHFGRWFRRAYGVTPAAYRRLCTGVPDRRAGTC